MHTVQNRTWKARLQAGLPVVLGLLLGLGLTGAAQAQMAQAQLTNNDVGAYLQEIRQLAEQALKASQAAEQASSVAGVKAQADEVFRTVWGVPSGLVSGNASEARMHGWKEVWQTTPAAFDSAFAARYGNKPPDITDPRALGIVGRGRAVRRHLEAVAADKRTPEAKRRQAEAIVVTLNNVIGWMKMDDGVTKGERQPRVDMTRVWDAPVEFWNSTADTGWLHEAYSQALNILKTDYGNDLTMARRHAADMTRLIQRYLNGVDVNRNGSVEPIMMEGGLQTVLEQAQAAGYTR